LRGDHRGAGVHPAAGPDAEFEGILGGHGGFITLAATLPAIGSVPVAGLTLLLGVDRFMPEIRALTNLVGNGVATIVVAKWERELDTARLGKVLNGEQVVPDEEIDDPVMV
jgi:aerobic C4-dicarboxylate transport protein